MKRNTLAPERRERIARIAVENSRVREGRNGFWILGEQSVGVLCDGRVVDIRPRIEHGVLVAVIFVLYASPDNRRRGRSKSIADRVARKLFKRPVMVSGWPRCLDGSPSPSEFTYREGGR